MRVDAANSRYQEAASVRTEFNRSELNRLRYLLRRLRFLETKIEQLGGMEAGSGGGVHAELELEALEYVLTEVGFIEERQD